MTFDHIMIRQGSPCFCGIKPANLFTVSRKQFDVNNFLVWKNKLKEYELDCDYVELSGGRILVLLYNNFWISKILSNPAVTTYLKNKGYLFPAESYSVECNDSQAAFIKSKEFIFQLLNKLKESEIFPHEIGIVLGYPVKDVIAFEIKQGKDFCYCGVWKCYSNSEVELENARLSEFKFRRCSGLCCAWFEQGCSLCQIIENYKKETFAA